MELLSNGMSFRKLADSFRSSIKTWDYFVNWDKVNLNTSKLEISLNKLNYLLGKEDLRSEFTTLFTDSPDIVRAIPALLAVRESHLEIYDYDTQEAVNYDFASATGTADEYFTFLEESGLSELFNSNGIKNLVDYVKGVEVGLDSNGRKNRGGVLMEKIVEFQIKSFAELNELEYVAQATSTDIREKWGVEVRVNKSERSFDFAVFNPKTNKLKLVEVNFYNGGGSKLKAVCGEFKGLYDELKQQGIEFVWITDGSGWKTALRPLEETFNHIDHLYNLQMIEGGALKNLDW